MIDINVPVHEIMNFGGQPYVYRYTCWRFSFYNHWVNDGKVYAEQQEKQKTNAKASE